MAHICLFHGLREFNKRGTHRKSDSAFAELSAASGGGDDPFAELNSLTGDTTEAGIESDLNRLANTSYLKIIGQRAREDEIEADLYGAAYAAQAGYDPNALAAYLERVRSRGEIHDAFRHHPSLDDRISELQSSVRRFHLRQRGQELKQKRFETETSMLIK
jgi:predicted Zn-dependent protease